jgi:hypothetical protein
MPSTRAGPRAQLEASGATGKPGFVPLELAAGELGDRPQPCAMFLELGQVLRAK